MKKIMMTASAFLFSMALTTGAFAAGEYGTTSQDSAAQSQSGATMQQEEQAADIGSQAQAEEAQVKSTNKLIGKAVRGSQGNEIGNISDLMVDTQTGQVGYALVSSGGVLGMGEDQYIVPWNALNLDPQTDSFSLDISQEKLQQAPKGETVADRQQAQEIHQFYGVSPYWEGGEEQRQPAQPMLMEEESSEQQLMEEESSSQQMGE